MNMSTRRARIKAVAALPQRRKNADNKIKQEQTKNAIENALKSPKERLENAIISPRVALSPRLVSPQKSPRVPCTPDIQKAPQESQTPSVSENQTKPEHIKPKQSDIFVSPQAKASPVRKRSPVVRTPVIEVEMTGEKVITAHKRLVELQNDMQTSQKESKVLNNRERIMSPIASNDRGCGANAKNIIEAYNSPNTPEHDVMDGIVPLRPGSNAPKPIDLLKNQIISENAEVLFDPIVPLPSPTKVRPKLRPVPRLGPGRRNSIPGSASESEDESKRALHPGSSTPVASRQRHDSHTSHSTVMSHPNRDVNRVRNDSLCSSQTAAQTPAPGSPMKEKEKVTKNRRMDVSRRMAAMRRRKESVQRDKLTMFDLIFYNPLTNPIVPDQDELRAKEASKKEEQRKQENNKKEEANEESNLSTEDAAPVPQIKLGPNGEIILDEQSLVIKQSEQRKLSDSVVHEGAWVNTTSKVYRRGPRTAEWSDAETVRFYRALAGVGTDFSLMAALFPGRSRKELKLKFKKEEKNNLAQIDKALRSVSDFNPDQLEKEFKAERKQAEENARKLKERLLEEKRIQKEQMKAAREMNIKQSKGAKMLGMSIVPEPIANSKECITANDILESNMRKPKKRNIRTNQEKPNTITDLTVSTPPIHRPKTTTPRMKNITPPNIPAKSPVVLNALPAVPADIAPGSLVVLTVDDPKAPSHKAIHTYIKQADGSIASVVLDANVMNSLVSFVKKDTPKTTSMSPSSVVSDRSTHTPLGSSPNKRQRLSSYSITDL